jgi:hypothetical protein
MFSRLSRASEPTDSFRRRCHDSGEKAFEKRRTAEAGDDISF